MFSPDHIDGFLSILRIIARAPFGTVGKGASDLANLLGENQRVLGNDLSLARLLQSSEAKSMGWGSAISIAHDAHELQKNISVLSTNLSPGARALAVLIGETYSNFESAMDGAADLHCQKVSTLRDVTLSVIRKRPARPRVAFLPEKNHACTQIRLLGPLEKLSEKGAIRLMVVGDPTEHEILGQTDLLILQRYGNLPGAQLMQAAKEIGVPVAIDFDDDFFTLPWFNIDADFFKKFPRNTLLSALIRGPDLAVVSTPHLKGVIGKQNPSVTTIHNIVDGGLFKKTESHVETDDTIFGYIGTRSHEADLEPIINPLRKLLETSNGKVRAVFIGTVPRELLRVPGVEYLGWYNCYHNAAKALSDSGVNVGLAPLTDLAFNKSKSAMKYLEYGACGIAGVYSDVEAYSRHIRHLENGYKVTEHTEKAWGAALNFMVNNPTERRGMADAAYNDTRTSHTLETELTRFWNVFSPLTEKNNRAFAPPVPRKRPAAPPKTGVTMAVFLGGDFRESLIDLARVIQLAGPEVQTIAVHQNDAFHHIMDLGDEIDSVLLTREDVNGLNQIMDMARGDAVLLVDQRATFDERLLGELAAALSSGAIGASPSLVYSRQEFTKRIAEIERDRNGKNEIKVSKNVAVNPRFCMVNRAAISQLGRFDDATPMEMALGEFFDGAVKNGRSVFGVDSSLVSMERYGPPPFLRRTVTPDSRKRVGSKLFVSGGSTLETFGLDGQRLAVVIHARPQSPYLTECVRRVTRHVGAIHTLFIDGNGERDEEIIAAHFGASLIQTDGKGAPFLTRFAEQKLADYVLFLHDGAMLCPGSFDEMLRVALGTQAGIVAPMANDGSLAQQVGLSESIPFNELDESFNRAFSKIEIDSFKTESIGGFCALLKTGSKVRSAAELNKTNPTIASRSYVHVLSHPPGVGPVGPFSKPEGIFAKVDEIIASVGPLKGTSPNPENLAVLRKLLGALRENPSHAGLLRTIGERMLGMNQMDQGMNLIDKSKKVDPFCS